ncbi:response regulator transcription factor [Herbaspirillum sp.]|uniref:LuxR C-terminal-related transcriptional regulator n=1 Tax=Herbaspirillum sp. TaxID=1890675 RepID=UPI0025BDB7EC|nr:response regulator transcription factor [Herbaspirillum sp.]
MHTTIRVMLVDDHETMLWGLSRLIESQRPRMELAGTARNIEGTLAAAAALSPDIIVLDLDLDGASAVDILPALLAASPARILVLSGSRDQALLDQAVKRGVRGVLCKTASAEQVIKAIEKIHLGELWLDHDTLGRVFGELLDPRNVARSNPEAERQSTLTAREQKVISAIVNSSGASNKTLAQALFISEHTLSNHLTSIYHKLSVSNRLELYVYAIKHQLCCATAGETERPLRQR